MSPTYKAWRDVPEDIRELVCAAVGGKEGLPSLVNRGFAFTRNREGVARLVTDLSQLTEGQAADARKQSSAWTVVEGLEGSSASRPYRRKGASLEEDTFVKTYSRTRHSRNNFHRTRIR